MQDNQNLVLVGVVNRRKDLGIALNRHWYRIPIKYAPKRKAKFLALYQTRIFRKEGKSINYYAPIQHFSLTSRRELLPEEKSHSRVNQAYYKLHLGPLRQLSQKIRNKSRRRINFGFTTLPKLFKSREISQLFDIKPLEEIMRKLLQRKKIKAIDEYLLTENENRRYRLDFALFCRKGKIDLECDNEKWHSLPSQKIKDRKRDLYLKRHGWTILRFEGNRIVNNPNYCIEVLNKAVRKLGGLS
jgi:very-short-patch-repair endonuclease